MFGVQRVNRAALPLMRSQGSGLLVVVSSVVGRMALPFFGPYNDGAEQVTAAIYGAFGMAGLLDVNTGTR